MRPVEDRPTDQRPPEADPGLSGDASIPWPALSAGLPEVFGLGSPTESDTPKLALRPLELALARAVSSHERNCHHVPPPLRALASMSEKVLTTEGSLARMRSALWAHRRHDFVEQVSERWLAVESEALTTAWGECPHGVGFPQLLEAARQSAFRLSSVASMLWALRADESSAFDWSFKLVCGLLRKEETKPSPAPEPAEKAGSSKTGDHRREVEVARLQEQLEDARSQNRELRKTRREATEKLGDAERELAQVRREVSEAGPRILQLEAELEDLKTTLAAARHSQRDVERRLREEHRRVEALQERADGLARELAVVQAHDLTLSKELNQARLRIKALERLLREGIPPEDRILAYLQAEKSRLEGDVIRLQGGDKQVAQQQKTLLKRVLDAFLEYRPQFRKPRPPVVLPPRPIRYYALGGADEIGASAYVLELAEHRILVDCGIRVGADISHLGPDLARLGPVDAVILTHAHTDHVGWTAALVKHLGEQGDFEIFATAETAKLLPTMLKDSRRQYERLAGQARIESAFIKGREPFAEAYEGADVEDALLRLRRVAIGEPIPLRGDVQFTLHKAGHILGASSVLVEGGGRRAFITGDFSDFPQRTVGARAWPEGLKSVDLLLLESTYGSRNHTDRSAEGARLVDEVKRIVDHGGVALIPCFALGRAQEVLAILAEAGVNFPVWIDGMIQDINEVYREAEQFTLRDNFHEMRTEGYSREEIVSRAREEGCAIVSTSGMLTGGPMVEYASRLLSDPKNRIFFCGYQDEESPGRMLTSLSRSDTPDRVVEVTREDGSKVRIRAASPARTFNLSAHSDQAGLLQAAEMLEPAHVVLVHGDDDSREALGEALGRARHHVHPSSVDFSLDCE